eukprot:179416-Chlamydomonas_euryale.AAC.1
MRVGVWVNRRALSSFADWTEDEVYGTMLPDAWRRKQGYATVRDANTAAAGVGKKGGKGPGDPIGMFKASGW